MSLRDAFENYKRAFRHKLSGVEALPQLAILGLLVGLLTSAVILLYLVSA